MLKVKELDKTYTIKTDDVMILVLLENAIQDHIEDLENLIDKGIFVHRHKQYKEEIERYKEYLKIL